MTKINITDIKPNPKNPRIIKDDKFKKLVQSIKDFPDMLEKRPLVIDESNVVLGGNMRLRALQELGYTEVPVIRADDRTQEQKDQFIIKDNVGFGERNRDDLANEWDEQKLLDWGMDLPDDLFVSDQEEIEKIQDKIPEQTKQTDIVQGDIIVFERDGKELHRLFCGDSTSEIHIKKLLEGKNNNITHCISDPPYGIKYDNKKDGQGMILNDDVILDYSGLAKIYTDGFFCMWTGYQVVDLRIQQIQKHFEKLTNMIIRHKGGGGMGDCARTLAQDFEILLVNNRGNEIQGHRGGSTRYRNQEEKEKFIKTASKQQLQTTISELSKGECVRKVGKDNNTEYMHPTQKPVEINERVLENFTSKGDNVLDLFGGSGSNMIACHKLQRKCYMMELDPKYCQVIVDRMHMVDKSLVIKKNGEVIQEEEWDDVMDNLK